MTTDSPSGEPDAAADAEADPGAEAAAGTGTGTEARSDDAPASRSAVSRARRVAGRSHVVEQTRAATGVPADDAGEDEPAPRPDRRSVARTMRRAAREASSGAVADDGTADEEGTAGGEGTADAPVRTSRAGRNLPAAIGVGLGLGVVIIASLFLYRPSFAGLVGVVVLYAGWELTRAMRSAGIRVTLLPLLVGSAATLFAAWERGPSGLVLGGLVTVLGVWVWRLGDGADGYGRDVTASTFAVLYLPVLAGFAVLLTHTHDGAGRVLAFIAVVVCSDTGGYATGVLFGRHPLAPIVSKGKTWEGFLGSVAACSAAGILFMVFTFHEAWWKGLLFGLALVVTATVGDLGESMIKRDLGIKDMGTLLPGHGGVMDRLDSLLPCAAVAYLLLSGFAPV